MKKQFKIALCGVLALIAIVISIVSVAIVLSNGSKDSTPTPAPTIQASPSENTTMFPSISPSETPTVDPSISPSETLMALPIQSVAAGWQHSCAVDKLSALWCWGRNTLGQLGLGYTSLRNAAPTKVTSLANGVSLVAAGGSHTCIVDKLSALWCWGRNNYGQLGLGDTSNRKTPTKVISLSNEISQVAAGAFHTCAIDILSTLWCWGYNFRGQLGLPDLSDRNTPTKVTSLSNEISQVATGGYHTCIVDKLSALWCWGYNPDGQLGLGNTSDRNIPTQVISLANGISHVAAGASHTCAIDNISTLWCWGSNGNGQLGLGDTSDRNTPTKVISLSNEVSQVGLGGFHTCAIDILSTLWCWGWNGYGELGLGDNSNRNIPTKVISLSNEVSQVATGGSRSFAIDNDNFWSWGRNDYGQLGLNDTSHRNIPTLLLLAFELTQ